MERLIEQIAAAVQAIMKEPQRQGAPADGWKFGVVRFHHDPNRAGAQGHQDHHPVTVILGELADRGKEADHE